uniref:Uncharacterized protein n=1 Tax=Rhizophora mucronata TaxID=61149 RepID=A0A2P2QHR0_RHIMU
MECELFYYAYEKKGHIFSIIYTYIKGFWLLIFFSPAKSKIRAIRTRLGQRREK